MTVRGAPTEGVADALRFGREIAEYARERATRLRATHADPIILAAELARQVEAPATRAIAAKRRALEVGGMTVRAAEAWTEAAARGYREAMSEGERLH